MRIKLKSWLLQEEIKRNAQTVIEANQDQNLNLKKERQWKVDCLRLKDKRETTYNTPSISTVGIIVENSSDVDILTISTINKLI